MDAAHTEGNLVTAPAWPAQAAWLAQLLAVLETKASVPYGMLDVFASAAGGFRVEEPAADLPLALALASVATSRAVREGLIAAGEVGLLGELRPVPRMEARIAEAKRLGFKQILLPARGRAVGTVSGIFAISLSSACDCQ